MKSVSFHKSGRLGLVCRVGAASAWSMTLALVGLWFAFSAPMRWPMFAELWRLWGVAAFGAGLFVFMVLVSDRLVPGASRKLVMAAELSAIFLFIGGLVALLWTIGGAS